METNKPPTPGMENSFLFCYFWKQTILLLFKFRLPEVLSFMQIIFWKLAIQRENFSLEIINDNDLCLRETFRTSLSNCETKSF